jgi:hypothetical protein
VWLQIKSVRKQSTKFGNVVVAETHPQPQKFLLGFQIKPEERLESVMQHVQTILQLSNAKPSFGLHASAFHDPQPLSDSTRALFNSEYAFSCCLLVALHTFVGGYHKMPVESLL